MLVSGYFDKLFFSDCSVSDPKIAGGKMIVCVRNIGVIEGHPLFERTGSGHIRYFRSSHLVFDDVESSLRELTDFVGDPRDRKFSKPYHVNDGPFPKPAGATRVFRFEGSPQPPHSWVDWTVTAASFTLEVLDIREPSWSRLG